MNRKILKGYITVLGAYLLIIALGIIKYNSQLAQYINYSIIIFNIIYLVTISYKNKHKGQ